MVTGQVVAVERGRGIVDIARVTGVSSSGDTVDLAILQQFVKELYIASDKPPTYEPVSNIRPIIYEYVPAQSAWIVLDQDLLEVTNYFQARQLEDAKEQSVVVTKAPRAKLSEDALKRQFFRPSKAQAFVAAALSLPLAAAFYAAFSTVRQTYDLASGGEQMTADTFRSIILFVLAASSAGSLVVGSALFLYAVSKGDDQQ